MLFTAAQMKEYNENGFIIIPNILSQEEVDFIMEENKVNSHLKEHTHERKDTHGGISKVSIWNHPPDNIYGRIARSHKIVDRCEEILGGEVYHWHAKMMIKEARTGGAWEWHQDYGYWYNNNCLTPDLISCMIGINHSTVENGCLQVLVGSHKLGRIDHGQVAGQIGADMTRVEQAEKIYKRIHVELKPGDALFFHSNLLHTSAPNKSDKPRLVYICCYNKKENSPFGPYDKNRHPQYTPLIKVNDNEILPLAHA